MGFVVAERMLHTPSMGFCLLVAMGFECLYQHKRYYMLGYILQRSPWIRLEGLNQYDSRCLIHGT